MKTIGSVKQTSKLDNENDNDNDTGTDTDTDNDNDNDNDYDNTTIRSRLVCHLLLVFFFFKKY